MTIRPETPIKRALWGDDHTTLGEITVELAGPRAAIALSKGAEPKLYPHVHPTRTP
ncbi:MAG: hypothetical protein ACRDWD_04520 [Acidimicrobiia bacterium]